MGTATATSDTSALDRVPGALRGGRSIERRVQPSAIRDVYVLVRRGDLLCSFCGTAPGTRTESGDRPRARLRWGRLTEEPLLASSGGDRSGRRPRLPEIRASPPSRPGPRRGVAVGGRLLRRERRARRPDEPGAGEMPGDGLASSRCAPEPDHRLRRACAQGRRRWRGVLRVAIVTGKGE